MPTSRRSIASAVPSSAAIHPPGDCPGRRLAGVGAALSFVLLVSIAQAAQPDVAGLLPRMADSMRQLDFEGSFVYQHGGRIDALRVFHLGGQRERERLISLTGPRSEIVRDNHKITTIQAGTTAVLTSSGIGPQFLPLVPNGRAPALGENYTVTVGGSDRVAGFDADIINVMPRDGYRYGYRLWLERNSRMLLRSALMAPGRSQPLEEFMFVSLDLGARPTAADLAPSALPGGSAIQASEIVVPQPKWRAEAPPPGFSLVRALQPAGSRTVTQQLVYSDGLASVSVYVAPQRRGERDRDGATVTRGALHVFVRIGNGLSVTALGKVPEATVVALSRVTASRSAKPADGMKQR